MANSWFEFVKNGAQNKEYFNKDWDKAPTDEGWGIEIRGYTFHKDGFRFVAQTFLENLRTKKMVLSPADEPASQKILLKVSHSALYAFDTAPVGPGTKG